MHVGVPKGFYITCERTTPGSMSGDFCHHKWSSLEDLLQLLIICNELLPPRSQDILSTDVLSILTASIQDVGLSRVSLNLGAKVFSQVQRSISGIKLDSSRILHFVLQRVLLIQKPTVI